MVEFIAVFRTAVVFYYLEMKKQRVEERTPYKYTMSIKLISLNKHMRSTSSNNDTAQIRLLVPKEWVQELDTLAASRFLTRLGLIRFYLRSQMDQDLNQYSEMTEQRRSLKNSHRSLQRFISEKD